MKVAVLGNGKSRFLFTNPKEYDYIIGCNIPWTDVNSTVIIDEKVVEFLYDTRQKHNYSYNTIFSRKSWNKVLELEAESYFSPLLNSIVEMAEGIDSSAHIALKHVLSFDDVEIVHLYGCDSKWNNDISSRTHYYVDNKPPNQSATVSLWNNRWEEIIQNNKHVEILFLGEFCKIS